KNSSVQKNGKTWDSMPCTKYEMKIHLEFLFSHPDNLVPLNIPWYREDRVWMTWDSQGDYRPETWNDNDPSTWKWQLDHIIPQSKLPYDNLNHPNLKKCWDLSNIRPLSAKQNIKDGNRRPINLENIDR